MMQKCARSPPCQPSSMSLPAAWSAQSSSRASPSGSGAGAEREACTLIRVLEKATRHRKKAVAQIDWGNSTKKLGFRNEVVMRTCPNTPKSID